MSTNQERQSLPKPPITLGQYFWGEVIKTRYDDARHSFLAITIALLEGKRIQYPGSRSDSGTSRGPLSETIDGRCPSKILVYRDRGLFLFSSIGVTGWPVYAAVHIGFGETVAAEVVRVDKHGAELLLSYQSGKEKILSDVHAYLSRSDYAILSDGSVNVPVVGQTLTDLVVEKSDPRRKVVYVSLRTQAKSLADVQQALNSDHAVVQVVEIANNSQSQPGQLPLEFRQIRGNFHDKQGVARILAFKFLNTATSPQIDALIKAFLNLPKRIAKAARFQIQGGINIGTNKGKLDEGFDYGFVLTFKSEQDRNTYEQHPAHKSFVEALLPILEKGLVLDVTAGTDQ